MSSYELGFFTSVTASASAIVCSEIGDSTFFIAMILSMTRPKSAVFSGALSANVIMHILSVLIGHATILIRQDYVLLGSKVLLIVLGIKMIKEGYNSPPDKSQKKFARVKKNMADKTEGEDTKEATRSLSRLYLLSAFEAFSLTFLHKWGDRSQIIAVLMTTHGGPSTVLIGGFVGHAICLVLAIGCGGYIANKVSIRKMTIFCGITFLGFAATSLLYGA